MMIKILIPAFIGGIIGWITNVLAIKMLFRPVYPVRIPLIGIDLQGLLPKRRAEIAVSIGETVEKELINIDDILKKLSNDENRNIVLTKIKMAISDSIDKKIPLLVPFIIKNSIVQYIEEQIDREAPILMEDLIFDLYEKASKEIEIGKMIEDKINQIDLIKLEEITVSIAKRELKHIEVLGGILGALIGLVQGIITQFLY